MKDPNKSLRNLTESARRVMSGEKQLNEADSSTPLDVEPGNVTPIPGGGSVPAPGAIALLVLAMWAAGMSAAAIAAYFGIPLNLVLLILKANPDLGPDNPITDPFKPGGKEEGNQMHPGWGGGSMWRVGAPSDNQPHQA